MVEAGGDIGGRSQVTDAAEMVEHLPHEHTEALVTGRGEGGGVPHEHGLPPGPGDGDVQPPQLLEEPHLATRVAAGEGVDDEIPLAADSHPGPGRRVH